MAMKKAPNLRGVFFNDLDSRHIYLDTFYIRIGIVRSEPPIDEAFLVDLPWLPEVSEGPAAYSGASPSQVLRMQLAQRASGEVP